MLETALPSTVSFCGNGWLLVATAGCWWQQLVVGGKRMLVAVADCWWQWLIAGGGG